MTGGNELKICDFLEYADCKGVTGDDVRLWLRELGRHDEFEGSGLDDPLVFLYLRLRRRGLLLKAIDDVERDVLSRPRGGLVFAPRKDGFRWPTIV